MESLGVWLTVYLQAKARASLCSSTAAPQALLGTWKTRGDSVFPAAEALGELLGWHRGLSRTEAANGFYGFVEYPKLPLLIIARCFDIVATDTFC